MSAPLRLILVADEVLEDVVLLVRIILQGGRQLMKRHESSYANGDAVDELE